MRAPYQMHQVVTCYFYALDMAKAIDKVVSSYHQCASLMSSSLVAIPWSSEEPPNTHGLKFAADVVRRNRRVIFVIRECVSSYTTALLIPDERKEKLRDAILKTCLPIRPIANPPAISRVDSAPGFKSLEKVPSQSPYFD